MASLALPSSLVRLLSPSLPPSLSLPPSPSLSLPCSPSLFRPPSLGPGSSGHRLFISAFMLRSLTIYFSVHAGLLRHPSPLSRTPSFALLLPASLPLSLFLVTLSGPCVVSLPRSPSLLRLPLSSPSLSPPRLPRLSLTPCLPLLAPLLSGPLPRVSLPWLPFLAPSLAYPLTPPPALLCPRPSPSRPCLSIGSLHIYFIFSLSYST